MSTFIFYYNYVVSVKIVPRSCFSTDTEHSKLNYIPIRGKCWFGGGNRSCGTYRFEITTHQRRRCIRTLITNMQSIFIYLEKNFRTPNNYRQLTIAAALGNNGLLWGAWAVTLTEVGVPEAFNGAVLIPLETGFIIWGILENWIIRTSMRKFSRTSRDHRIS